MSFLSQTKLICPLTSATVADMRAAMQEAARQGADILELRLDFLEEIPTEEDIAALLKDAPRPVIVTCRPQNEGGRFGGDEGKRRAVLHTAAAMRPDYMDCELSIPYAERPPGTIILSYHNFQGPPQNLEALAFQMEASHAQINKIAFMARGPEDALLALELMRSCAKPSIMLAMGEAGLPSRLLARKFGGFGVFAALRHGAESAPAQPTLGDVRHLYRWDAIDRDTRVYGVIGCPIAHSLSPAVQNAAFENARMNAVYVPLRVEPGRDAFNRFMDSLLAKPWLDFDGLSVTIPHKENALAYIGAENCDELSRRIGAVNTITIGPGGKLRGDNTDYAAAVDSLCHAMGTSRDGLAGKAVAVLGAGGAARSIVAGLTHHKAAVTIYNRTLSRAQALAEEFSCRAAELTPTTAVGEEVVVNCTPLGMWPQTDQSPLASVLGSTRVVFDTIYNPPRTRLLEMARREGKIAVSGVEMFVNQAAAQFEIWTGKPAPRKAMRKAITLRVGE